MNITMNIIEQPDTSKMNKSQLLSRCSELGIIKCKSKTKCELIELINTKTHSHIIICVI